jgi:hypothetical protein
MAKKYLNTLVGKNVLLPEKGKQFSREKLYVHPDESHVAPPSLKRHYNRDSFQAR